ncbi:MAG: hypothetical protein HUJ78_06675 [Mogibacterium sp.]|nr:hypothetical protein [Mogibacterium sp.]
MKNNKRVIKVKLNVKPSDAEHGSEFGKENHVNHCFKAVEIAVTNFETLETIMQSREEARRIASDMEFMYIVGDSSDALEVLRVAFCAAGLICGVCAVDYILDEGHDNPQLMDIFVEAFFESELIDTLLEESRMEE